MNAFGGCMNSQLHKDDGYDDENPPIFTPSHNANSAPYAIPPSFTPNRTKQVKQSNNNTNANQAPSFAPASHRIRNIKSSEPKIIKVANYAPSNNPTQLNQANNASYLRNQSFDAGSSNNFSEKSVHPHRFLHAFFALVAVLAIVCVAVGAYSWNWVDSHINRTQWLTNTPSTQGTAWLILGSDQREGAEAKEITGFRTDTILVLTKPNNGNSSLISIPRDSLVSLNGKQMKINAVAQYAGNKALTSTIETITGHRIDHVAEIRFDGLTNVVNALDGIDLCYNRTVSDRFSGLNWTAGCHHVDGATALAFSRMRYADPQSDFGRAARQRMVIAAIMKKALDHKTLTNFGKAKKLAETGLASVLLDENSNPGTLWQMAQAFKDATGPKGVTGTVYWTNPDYRVQGIGSSVLLDDVKNTELFNELASGAHKPGAVGPLAELTK